MPDPDDAVIDAGGVALCLDEPALRLLDGRVVDAEPEDDGVRFTVFDVDQAR